MKPLTYLADYEIILFSMELAALDASKAYTACTWLGQNHLQK